MKNARVGFSSCCSSLEKHTAAADPHSEFCEPRQTVLFGVGSWSQILGQSMLPFVWRTISPKHPAWICRAAAARAAPQTGMAVFRRHDQRGALKPPPGLPPNRGRAVKQDFFSKKVLEDVEKVLKRFTCIEPVTNQTPDALDLEAPSLRDIARACLRDLLCSRLSSSMLALRPELASRIRVRDRRYEIFNLAAL